MNRAELVRKLREDLLDDVPDMADPTDSDYEYSTATLARYLSEAEDEACRRSDLIFDATNATFTDVTLVDGTATYTLDSKITKVTAVKLDNELIKRTTRWDLDRSYSQWPGATAGDPSCYFFENGKLTFYPAPDATAAAKTCTVTVYRLPQYPLRTATDIPEIPAAYHPHLCYYAAYLAFLRPDEDHTDPQKAALMSQLFDRYFGPAYTAHAEELLKDYGDALVIVPE